MLKRTIIIFLIAFIIIISLPNMIFANDGMDNIMKAGDDFLQAGTEEVIDKNALKDTSNYIYNILFTIAVVLAVAVGMIIGIQFITGSVDEKAKVKETLVPYIVGVFVVFSAFTIWKLIVTFGNQNIDITMTYTKDSEGNLYCYYCSDILSNREQHSGRCYNCGKDIIFEGK